MSDGQGSEADADTDPDSETEVAAAEDPNEPTEVRRGLSDRAAFWTSGVLALVIAVGSVWLVGIRGIHFEALNRVSPTIEGGGVGAAWVQGNTLPALDWMITLVHVADVLMGVGILVMFFVHWIAFRRLAARMRPPDAPRRSDEAVATDGGERSNGSRSSSDFRSDGGSEARPTGAPRDRERAGPASDGGEAE
ncbi:hypothetical protein [Halalkalicoccus tibetensis]|uniref:Uncharacterized protein n=1 Tax=Halalkalicoccus tibetensis TaxID=175632 RepID=A0ABD5V8C6_9EURY